jgi:hypothetical protein
MPSPRSDPSVALHAVTPKQEAVEGRFGRGERFGRPAHDLAFVDHDGSSTVSLSEARARAVSTRTVFALMPRSLPASSVE